MQFNVIDVYYGTSVITITVYYAYLLKCIFGCERTLVGELSVVCQDVSAKTG